MMKKYRKYILVLFLIFMIGCVNSDVMPIVSNTETINSQILKIENIGGYYNVKYVVSPGTKYSVQIYHFGKEEPTKTYQLSSVTDTVNIKYDFSDLESGVYDLSLTSIDGIVTKKPLIKK
jgi:hypothetical protein